MSSTRPTSGADEATNPDSPAGRMMRALEQLVTSVIGEQLRLMLESADEILFEMAQQSNDGAQQRLYLDTMRVIRLERPHLMRAFHDSLKHTFADVRLERAAANIDLEDLESWSVQGEEETEETVAVSKLEGRAESLYQKEIVELENRLEALAERTHSTVSPKLISPGRIFSAFRDTMRSLEVEFPIKLVIYRLAERTMLSNLRDVYVGANRILAQSGYEPLRTRPASATPRKPAPRPAPAEPAVGPAPPPGPTLLPTGLESSQIMTALASHAIAGSLPNAALTTGQPGTLPGQVNTERLVAALEVPSGSFAGHSDADLANEFAGALRAIAQGRRPPEWIPASNLSLVGRMFDAFYQDTRLPEDLRALLGKLQYPVMKVGMADPDFFRRPDHAVRRFVHDVYDMIAGADHPGPAEQERIAELIQHIAEEFRVDPAHFRTSDWRATPVSEAEGEAFLAEEERQMAGHRTRMLEKVRRLVAQELRLRTLDRAVPRSLMPLLLSGFGPMLAVHFLRGGERGSGWKDSLVLLDRLLGSLGTPVEAAADRDAFEADLIAAVTHHLLEVGLPEDKVQRLVAGLVEGYRQLRDAPSDTGSRPSEQVAERAKAEARQSLGAVLTPGNWFRLVDPVHGKQRWLRLHAYNGPQDHLLFADFAGEHHLRLGATAFVGDLLSGRAVAIDPSPAVRRSLELLRPLEGEARGAQNEAEWRTATYA